MSFERNKKSGWHTQPNIRFYKINDDQTPTLSLEWRGRTDLQVVLDKYPVSDQDWPLVPLPSSTRPKSPTFRKHTSDYLSLQQEVNHLPTTFWRTSFYSTKPYTCKILIKRPIWSLLPYFLSVCVCQNGRPSLKDIKPTPHGSQVLPSPTPPPF